MALPCVGCISKTPGPARPEDSTGVTPCLSAGAWPQGAPFPCSIAHWLCSESTEGRGALAGGVQRGSCSFQDLEPGLPGEAQPHLSCLRS